MLEVLPHRPPFLFVDGVIELEVGKHILAYWDVKPDAPFFAGHFPGNPIMPGVLQIEALAQAGAILCHESKLYDTGRQLAVLSGIDEARFRRIVRPGDRLELEVELLAFKRVMGKLKARASVRGLVTCEAIILAAIQPIS